MPNLTGEDSDDELDKCVPTIIPKTKQEYRQVKSKFKGVFQCGKKFKAQIQTNGVQHYLGLFETEEEAARAYDVHARQCLGGKAKTNYDYVAPGNGASMNGMLHMSNSEMLGVVLPQLSNHKMMHMDEIQHPLGRSGLNSDHSHSKRSYVGIKARRKLDNDLNHNRNMVGVDMSSSYGINMNGMGNEYANMSHNHNSMAMAHSHNAYVMNSNPAHYGVIGQNHDDIHGSGEPPNKSLRMADNDGSVHKEQHVDWREQVYYWTGELSVDVPSKRLYWRGSWLGSFVGKPEADEFAWSHNGFEYVSDPIENITINNEAVTPPATAFFSGFYMMDAAGIGRHEKYFDKHFFIEFQEVDANANKNCAKYHVIGKGDSEFGPFLLSGTYDMETRVMEMSRQYIEEKHHNQQIQSNQNMSHQNNPNVISHQLMNSTHAAPQNTHDSTVNQHHNSTHHNNVKDHSYVDMMNHNMNLLVNSIHDVNQSAYNMNSGENQQFSNSHSNYPPSVDHNGLIGGNHHARGFESIQHNQHASNQLPGDQFAAHHQQQLHMDHHHFSHHYPGQSEYYSAMSYAQPLNYPSVHSQYPTPDHSQANPYQGQYGPHQVTVNHEASSKHYDRAADPQQAEYQQEEAHNHEASSKHYDRAADPQQAEYQQEEAHNHEASSKHYDRAADPQQAEYQQEEASNDYQGLADGQMHD